MIIRLRHRLNNNNIIIIIKLLLLLLSLWIEILIEEATTLQVNACYLGLKE